MIGNEVQKITGRVSKTFTLQGKVNVGSVFQSEGADVPVYEGPYSVVPSLEDHILTTSDKLMTDDVTVKQIPCIKVSNISGGMTITIGGE